MNPETALQNQIRLKCSRGPTRLFRNNVGALRNAGGGMVRYGLAHGSADLIGWTTEIQACAGKVMLDKVRRAIFVAIECKIGRAKLTDAQISFLLAVRAAGGYAGVARSVEDAEAVLRGELTPL